MVTKTLPCGSRCRSPTSRAVWSSCATTGAQSTCGRPGPERAVPVSNPLRRRSPRPIALSANSPFFCGRDTGVREPVPHDVAAVAGLRAPPRFSSHDAYERLLTALVDRGDPAGPSRALPGHPALVAPPDHRGTGGRRSRDGREERPGGRAGAGADGHRPAGRGAGRHRPRALRRTAGCLPARDGLRGEAVDACTGRRHRPTACWRRCCATSAPPGRRPATG
ncbi:glutamate-cysteine ligase family protein [Streptomyces pulveraceus]|uniref:Glutamate-cysteine ligase family protein n=1 Tax=Streptomyces pulveraceus TaxID=68258 RepID=A0ABW1GKC3_9ACTN